MPVDTSIYNAISAPPKSALDYANEFARSDAMRNQNALTGIQLRQAASVDEQRNALRGAVQSGQLDLSDPNASGRALTMAPDVAPALLKTIQDQRTSGALALKDTAQAGNFKADAEATSYKTQLAKANQSITDVTNMNSPADALASLHQHLQRGDIDPDKYQSIMSTLVPSIQDPSQFAQWKRQTVLGLMDAKDRIAATAPKVEYQKAGGSLVPTNVNADAGQVGAVPGAASIKMTVSPDAQLQANTSTANNRANIQKDLLVAGIGPDGAPTADVAATVKAIGEGRMAPPTLQALRNPRMASIMNQVNQQYPNFDATVYGERQKAMKDFGTGPQGQQVQAANTALNHLDTLEQLAKAQANGNIPLFNQLANRFAAETGSQVPTNLQGAITLVGPEISKAVVGAGGGQGDREKVDAALSAITKGSPDQQAGQIATMKDIFGGRLSEVGRTYQRSTHLDNFGDMLSPAAQAIYAAKHGPGAKTPAASGAVPDDIAAILAKHGGK